jgi:hypothetical protein
MTEEEVLAKYSTPGLKRNVLSRSAKKLNMEFDERLKGMTTKERDDFLDRYWGLE